MSCIKFAFKKKVFGIFNPTPTKTNVSGCVQKVVFFLVVSELAQTKSKLKKNLRPYRVVDVEYTIGVRSKKTQEMFFKDHKCRHFLKIGHECVPHFDSVWEKGFGKSLCPCSELTENDNRLIGKSVSGWWKLFPQVIRDKSINDFE